MEQSLKSIWGEWELLELIGEGSFGKVYKAAKKEHGAEMFSAIKIITIPRSAAELKSLEAGGLSSDESKTYLESIVDSCINEIKIMIALSSASAANIVQIFDYKVNEKKDQIGWDIYIRMELLSDLDSHRIGKNLGEKEITKIGLDICTALEYCAGQRPPIIHRDIKPGNIFATQSGSYKLGDFGIAHELERSRSLSMMAGTPEYMAPEVFSGEPYGSDADIYSLGIVLYKLANNNRLPFCDAGKQILGPTDLGEALERRFKGECLPAPANAGGSLARAILKACAHDPKERFRTITDFKEGLLAIGGAGGTGNKPPKPILAKRGVFFAMATILITAIATIYFAFFGRDPPGRDESADIEKIAASAANESAAFNGSPSGWKRLELPTSLADNWDSYQVKMYDDIYSFPMAYGELAELGWLMDDGKSSPGDILVPYEHKWMYFSHSENPELAVKFAAYNADIDSRPISGCLIAGVNIQPHGIVPDLDRMGAVDLDGCVTLPGGITWDSATKENIIELYGEPSTIYKPNIANLDHTVLGYSRPFSEGTNYYQIAVREAGKIYSLQIYRETIPEGYVQSVASPENTYNNIGYDAPGELGTDPSSGIVMYGGALYRLPCPIGAFLENGWSISENTAGLSVAGHGYRSITMDRGDASVDIRVHNDSPMSALAENCRVKRLYATYSSGTELILPGNIAAGMSKIELETALANAEITYTIDDSSNYYIEYRFGAKDGGANVSVAINIDKKEKSFDGGGNPNFMKVHSISIEKTK